MYLAHCDREGRYRFVNRAYAARFGLEPDQMVGRLMADVVGPDGTSSSAGTWKPRFGASESQFELEIPDERLGPR